MVWLWARIRGMVGGNPEEEAALREELGGEDPGEADERYLAESGTVFGGLATQDAADVAEADLDDMKPPRDPAP
jgi:hypothetical protein